jgi:hypothetical protein
VLICVATPLHLQVMQYLATVPEGRPTFAAPAELYPLFSRYRDLPKEAKLQMEPVQKAVPMGNVEGIAKVLTALQTLHARMRILPETTSPLSALRARARFRSARTGTAGARAKSKHQPARGACGCHRCRQMDPALRSLLDHRWRNRGTGWRPCDEFGCIRAPW